MNRYPLWKNLLIVFVLAIGVFYALPRSEERRGGKECRARRRM